MCGLVGIISYDGSLSYVKSQAIRRGFANLLKNSENRGRMASGVCSVTDKDIFVFKNGSLASKLLEEKEYYRIVTDTVKTGVNLKCLLGHTRHPTKGSAAFNVNNHPILAGKVIGLHNGHIQNDDILFSMMKYNIKRIGQVDSEIIFRLLDHELHKGRTLIDAVKSVHDRLLGDYACAFVDSRLPRYLTIFTNAESYSNLYLYVYPNIKVMAFASTEEILKKSLKGDSALEPGFASTKTQFLNGGARIDMENGGLRRFELSKELLPFID